MLMSPICPFSSANSLFSAANLAFLGKMVSVWQKKQKGTRIGGRRPQNGRDVGNTRNNEREIADTVDSDLEGIARDLQRAQFLALI